MPELREKGVAMSNSHSTSDTGRFRAPVFAGEHRRRPAIVALVRDTYAVVDKFCVIPDGFTTGFDRAEDEARFHVTPQGTTLITPEMMGQSMHDYG